LENKKDEAKGVAKEQLGKAIADELMEPGQNRSDQERPQTGRREGKDAFQND
jgi:hypothetical protein